MDEEALFAAALGKASPAERLAFLAEACGGDADLRARVEALLQAHDHPDSFLQAPVLAAPSATVDEPIRERPGTVIGHYKLLEQIGEGGFGIVFLAEQQQPVRRKVALKILKPGMDSRPVIARFEAERQALALMDHQNIAKVLDGGETANGRPYFVMELVRGIPITDYCDQNQLTPRERLELFVCVCQAVQHAHQKGIIHRDIKPSNVLVTLQDGMPLGKVIDFGIAKALGQQLTDKTLFTGFAQMIGTPLYMSPEQAALSNVDVDTRSDIYSLGVLLYELLTGTTPFSKERLRQADFDEMRRIIREEEPPKPSTRVTTLAKAATTVTAQRKSDPRRLSQFLRGDLDWIVMKALAKDRNQRYATAKELADDVERFLDDRPVQARPPTLGDRLRKWARRHKALVRAGAALVGLAVVALAVGTVLLNAKNQELARANSQEREARAQGDTNFELAKEGINAFLNGVTEDRDLQIRGDFHLLRKRLLASAVPFLEKLVQQKPGDDRLEAQRAWAFGRLGFVRQQTGATEQGLADLEQMRAILERLAGDHPAEGAHRRDLAQAHTNRGAFLHELNRHEEALAAFGQAQALWDGLAAPVQDPEMAMYRINRGNVLQDLGRYEEAVADYQAALAVLDQVMADSPRHRREQAVTRNNLANALRHLRRREEALVALSRAVQIQEELLAEAPDDPGYGVDRAATRISLGKLLQELNRPDEALATFEKVLDSMERLAAKFPTVPRPRQYQAMTYNAVVYLLSQQRQFDEALASSQKGLVVQEKLVADFPKVPQFRSELATAYMNRGAQLAQLGRLDEARAPYEKALALHEALAKDFPKVPDYAVNLGGSYCNMGAVLSEVGRPEEALTWLAKAIATLGELPTREPGPPTARQFLCNSLVARAQALDKLQRYPEALQDWDRALALEEGPRRVFFRRDRAATLARAGRHAEAVAEANALAEAKDLKGATLYDLACTCALAAAAVKEDAKLQEQYAARAVALLRQAIGKGIKDAAHMKKDTDLDALRAREDFRKLLADLDGESKE
jgi:serine/threonine protein kinase/tetratricopeptide (TPR) repeat protein